MHLARSLRSPVSRGRAVAVAGVWEVAGHVVVIRGECQFSALFSFWSTQDLSPWDGAAHTQGPCSEEAPWRHYSEDT